MPIPALLWSMLPSAISLGSQLLSKPDRPRREDFVPDTGFLDKYIASLKGRRAERGTFQTAIKPAIRRIAGQGRQAQRQIGESIARAGLKGGGIEAGQRLRATQVTTQALQGAGERATALQLQESRRIGEKVDVAVLRKEEAIETGERAFSRAERQFRSQERQRKSRIGGAVAGLAVAGVGQFLQGRAKLVEQAGTVSGQFGEEIISEVLGGVERVQAIEGVAGVQEQIHTVKSGESLSLIAQQEGISLQELRDQNPGISDVIQPGQEIKIKAGVEAIDVITGVEAVAPISIEEALKDPTFQRRLEAVRGQKTRDLSRRVRLDAGTVSEKLEMIDSEANLGNVSQSDAKQLQNVVISAEAKKLDPNKFTGRERQRFIQIKNAISELESARDKKEFFSPFNELGIASDARVTREYSESEYNRLLEMLISEFPIIMGGIREGQRQSIEGF